jgi:deazaflavin-dependent oxidoreductase (nitroreductase family)
MDLQPTLEKLVGRYFLYVHQWLFEVTDGRITWLGGLPVLLLRTIGRKTGIERTAALVYLEDGKDLVIVASNGGSDTPPAWLGNLEKTPIVGVQIGRERRRMRAGIADRVERARLWPLVNQRNAGRYDVYQSRTEREIPLVILSAERDESSRATGGRFRS